MMEINIGIDRNDREQIANALSKVQADTYTLNLKTHNYHWNVKGPMFQTLRLRSPNRSRVPFLPLRWSLPIPRECS